MPKADGVLFCGGGTGGHVLPGLAVADALRRRPGAVGGGQRWIGDPERIEARLVPAAGIPLLPLGLGRPRLASPRWWLRSLRLGGRVLAEMSRRPPRVVVALGGYAALLPGLAARMLRRPLVVLEQNARAGKTNRLLALGAKVVVTQFDETASTLPACKVLRLGNPVRPIAQAPRGAAGGLRLLVTGGSLGARTLNDLLVAAAPRLAAVPGLSVVHLAGEDDRVRVADAYRSAGLPAEVMGFCDDMPALLRRVDLAISRSGATTVAELCSAGIGALYIPLPWAADDHQTANAGAVASAGGAEVLPQAGLTADTLAARIAALAGDLPAVAAMGRSARALARPGAAFAVARLVDWCGAPRRRQIAHARGAARARFRAGLAAGGAVSRKPRRTQA